MTAKPSPFKIRLAIQKVNKGELIAYPTEAIYGLGCNPLDEEAVLKLLALKNRSIDKGLILIASSLEQLTPYLQLTETIVSRIQASLSEPVTWVIPAQIWVPKWLTGTHDSLAIRITNHPVARLLCVENEGPLVSTSANVSSLPAAKKPWKVGKSLNTKKLFIVPGEVGDLKQATPILDILNQQKLR